MRRFDSVPFLQRCHGATPYLVSMAMESGLAHHRTLRSQCLDHGEVAPLRSRPPGRQRHQFLMTQCGDGLRIQVIAMGVTGLLEQGRARHLGT